MPARKTDGDEQHTDEAVVALDGDDWRGGIGGLRSQL